MGKFFSYRLFGKINLIWSILLVILIIFAVLGIKSVFYNGKASVDSEYISGLLTKQSELTTAELNYTGMSEYKDTGIKFINRSDFIMVYHATARAGIDMEQVEVDVDNGSKTVKLIIPKAQVLDVKVDTDTIKYFDEGFALLNWDEKEDGNEALALAEKDAKKEVAQMGILEIADSQAETLIKGLLEEAVPDDYEFKIEFKEAKEKEDEAAGNAAEKQLKDEEAANEENKEQ